MREDAALLAEQKTGSVDPYVPVHWRSAYPGRTDAAGAAANKLKDADATFQTWAVQAGWTVKNRTDGTETTIVSVDSEIQLTVTDDLFDNSEFYTVYSGWTRIDNLGDVARIIDPLDYSQEPYGALATIHLHNEDSAFDAYDLRGKWIRIGWGMVVNEVSYPPYLKCIGQDFTSTPEGDEDTYIIQCEGAWNILERLIIPRQGTTVPHYFFNQPGYDPGLDNKTGKEIVDYILERAGLDLGADIGALDGKITTWKPKFDMVAGENGAEVMRRLLAIFKCVLVPRTDCMHLKYCHDISGTTTSAAANKLIDSGATFQTEDVGVGFLVHNTTDDTYAWVTAVDSEIQLTLDADIMASAEGYEVLEYLYKVPSDASYHPFISGQSRSLTFKPAKVSVWDADPPTFSGEYGDPSWTEDMGLNTYIDIYGVVVSNDDCVFIARAAVERAKSNVETGWIFVPIMNCLQELYDKVTVIDGRGNISGTGRVGGFYGHYRPGHPDGRMRYCCEVRLGGLQRTLPTDMQSFVDQLDIGGTGGIPGSLLLPHSITPDILRQAMQAYDCDIEPDPLAKKLTGTIAVAAFTIGEAVTGAPSGATGEVAYSDAVGAGSVIIADITGAFAAGDTVTGADSGATINGGLAIADAYTQSVVVWKSGTLHFADGTSLTILPGTITLADAIPLWLYFIEGNHTLQNTASWGLAIGKDRDVVTLIQQAEEANQQASWESNKGKAGLINTRILIANMILAEHIKAGEIVADHIALGELIIGDKVTGDIDGLDAEAGGSTYFRILRTDISGGHILLSSTTQAAGYRTASDTEKGVWNVKTQTFIQDGIPTSIAIGDIWIDTNDENKLYIAASAGADEIAAGEWVLARDTEITQLRTDIEAGTITLSSLTTISGKWYVESGVEIDATTGIDIYGTNMAFTTSKLVGTAITGCTQDGASIECTTSTPHGMVDGDMVVLRGMSIAAYDNKYIVNQIDATRFQVGTTYTGTATGYAYQIQCSVDADGAIAAGAGAVTLDSLGLKIFGEGLYFYGTESYRAKIEASEAGNTLDISALGTGTSLWLYASDEIVLAPGGDVVRPSIHFDDYLGTADCAWDRVYTQDLLVMRTGGGTAIHCGGGNKAADIGADAVAFDDVYADDFVNKSPMMLEREYLPLLDRIQVKSDGYIDEKSFPIDRKRKKRGHPNIGMSGFMELTLGCLAELKAKIQSLEAK